MPKSKYSFFILIVIAAILSLFASNQPSEEAFDGLEITFIDVGQGDSVLIKEPSGNVMLVDCGEEAEFDTRLKPFLNANKVQNIDVLLATHYHSDHMGAMENIFDHLTVKTLIVPDYTPNSKTKSRLLKAASKEKAEVIQVSEGASIPSISPDLKISVLHPTKNGFSDDENNNSIVLLLEYFGTTILLTGDIEEDAEKAIVKKYDIETDILKVAHHGSFTSTSKEFLEAADPIYAVIQCGEENRYGHPHYETTSKLLDDDVRIYRTDVDKNIHFYIGKKGIESIKTSEF